MINKVSAHGYRDIFYHGPIPKLILSSDFKHIILDVNAAYLNIVKTDKSVLIGKSFFDVFPSSPNFTSSKNKEIIVNSFVDCIVQKTAINLNKYRYDMFNFTSKLYEEKYWNATNSPVINDQGDVDFIIHSPIDITSDYKAQEKQIAGIAALSFERNQLYSTFMQAPVGIMIFKGDNYIVDLVNPPLCELYGMQMEDFIGKPIFEVLTQSKDLGYDKILDEVMQTGISYKGNGVVIPIVRDDTLIDIYMDFVFEPLREDDGTISGVIAVGTEVTEQILATQKLEEAEERNRLAVDALGLGTYDINLTTGELTCSDLCFEICGVPKYSQRRDFVKVFHPEDLEIRNKAHENALKTGILKYDARIIWPDQTVRRIRLEGKLFYSKESKPTRIIGTVLDITTQHQLEIKQRQLIALVDNSVDLMSILNPNGYNSYINNAGLELIGFDSLEQVLRTNVSELHTPEDYEYFKNNVRPSILANGHWSGRINIKHLKTGEIFPVYCNCVGITDENTGDLLGIGAVMRDMRPELASKKALAESEQLLRGITTAAPAGLWMTNENGMITYVNQTWLDWTGKTFDSQLAKGWFSPIVEEDRIKVQERFRENLTQRTLFEVEFRLQHIDGTFRWCVATGSPQYLKDGHFSGFIGACTDISEQKQLQQQKDDFIGIASHELKTPVTSIKAYTQVLERLLRKKGDIKEADMIKKMDAQINRLTNLIGDLLDVTKINSGKLQFNDREFDFNELVNDLIEDLQRTTEKHQLIADLKPTGLVYGDKERIGQVVTNLITNAIKYSPDADKIIIHSILKNDEVTLCVEDFGIGISDDKLDQVFEQFYRVSGDMQHTFPGLGLGLYISAEIIKRENGKIWVNSVHGKGSTFCFSLPKYQN